jgi:hypothetical protein
MRQEGGIGAEAVANGSDQGDDFYAQAIASQLLAAMNEASFVSTQETAYPSGKVTSPSIEYTNDFLTGTNQPVVLPGSLAPLSTAYTNDILTDTSQAVTLSGNMAPPLITFSDVKNKLVSSPQAATIQVT